MQYGSRFMRTIKLLHNTINSSLSKQGAFAKLWSLIQTCIMGSTIIVMFSISLVSNDCHRFLLLSLFSLSRYLLVILINLSNNSYRRRHTLFMMLYNHCSLLVHMVFLEGKYDSHLLCDIYLSIYLE